MKEEMRDTWTWLQGMYNHEAFAVVISNAFADKGAKPAKYREQPIMVEAKNKNRVLTEEEKQNQIDMLFGQLEVMQHNFERTHGE